MNDICSVKKARPENVPHPVINSKPIPHRGYKTKFVKYDKFLDINCSYINPIDIDESVYGYKNTDLTVFHNNIRTMNNFENIEDIFVNCESLPDIIAVTETRLKTGKSIPTLDGYTFENVNSPTDAGGVGVYVSNELNYCVKTDLSLGLKYCEDIWLKLDLKDGKPLIIGIIYRHPPVWKEGKVRRVTVISARKMRRFQVSSCAESENNPQVNSNQHPT